MNNNANLPDGMLTAMLLLCYDITCITSIGVFQELVWPAPPIHRISSNVFLHQKLSRHDNTLPIY